MLQGDLPLKDSQKGAFFASGTLHLLFLVFLAAQGLFAPPAHKSSKKLIVQSIALKTGCPSQALPSKKASPPQQEVAFSGNPQEQPGTPSPVEEKPAPEPILEETPPREEKAAEKPAVSSATEESAPPPAPSTSKKPSKASTQAPKPKTAAKEKTVSKTKTAPKQTQKSTSAPATKSNASSAPSYDKRLVAEALSRLDKSVKATSSSGPSTGHGGSSKGSSGKVSHVGSVGALHSDSGVSFADGTAGAPEFGPTSAEGCYIADLIRRLQLNIRLPEPGEIRIKLTLKKSGEILSVIVVSCRNEKIKKSLFEKLKKVHFSPFGQSFPGEKEHTFLLKLSNDLTWSCS